MSDNKVAMITAGGSGMGADAARRLAADGFRVAILSSSGKGEALAEELGGVGFTGSNLVADDLTSFVSKTVDALGRIDVLVNSSGHGPKGDILEISDEDWHAGMEVYLLNVIRPARLVALQLEVLTAAGARQQARALLAQPTSRASQHHELRAAALRTAHALRDADLWHTLSAESAAVSAHPLVQAALPRQVAGWGQGVVVVWTVRRHLLAHTRIPTMRVAKTPFTAPCRLRFRPRCPPTTS